MAHSAAPRHDGTGQGLEWKARSAVGMRRVICWWGHQQMGLIGYRNGGMKGGRTWNGKPDPRYEGGRQNFFILRHLPRPGVYL
ncbi:hypothetical protein D4L85_12325 [Chryseolinea soli]|uniref:Uncharacterized protein n=1 Tax=Chryseolinea soli TaxID=2321403 RepID=A0A385SLG6_9BACT|nr:hypothetical protein D4L85_12325 [Chryseolinea soli]